MGRFMDRTLLPGSGFRPLTDFRCLRVFVACGCVFSGTVGQAQTRGSLAGEEAAQALKKSIAAEEYNLRCGPVRLQTQGSLGLGYTDNVFYSENNRKADFLVNPEVDLRALWPVTELNTLRLSLGLEIGRASCRERV